MALVLLKVFLMLGASGSSSKENYHAPLKEPHFRHSVSAYSTPRLGDRKYVATKLWLLFFEPSMARSEDVSSAQISQEYFTETVFKVLSSPHAFGGPCNVYRAESYSSSTFYPAVSIQTDFSDGCPRGLLDGSFSPVFGFPSPLRDGILAQVCDQIVFPSAKWVRQLPKKELQATHNLLSGLNISIHSPIEDSHLKALYNYVYPGKTLQPETLNELKKLLKHSQTSERRWQVFAYSLCRSLATETL